MRNEPDLPREHVRAWLLILVGASSTAGLTPLPVQLFHRMVFLSNSLAQLYETQPPAELVLKQDRGPYVCVRRTHVDAQSTRRIQLLAGTQRCGSNSLI